jgi:hypothetical protein
MGRVDLGGPPQVAHGAGVTNRKGLASLNGVQQDFKEPALFQRAPGAPVEHAP